jgi:hypothetical protein
MLIEAGFADVEIGEPVNTFDGAGGEENARAYDVRGYAFRARRPTSRPSGMPAERRPLR